MRKFNPTRGAVTYHIAPVFHIGLTFQKASQIPTFVKNLDTMLIQIEIPDSMLAIPSYSKEDVMLDLAVALYQRKLYSLAKAARFAGLNRIEFQKILAERHVPIFYDLEIDLKTLNEL